MATGGVQETGRHPMGVVSQRTGLTAHALRAWERRYGAVTPVRSEGGQRLYSDADVLRLRLLKRLTDAGRPIGLVARLETAELARLAGEDTGAGSWPGGSGVVAPAAERHLAECLVAAERLDGPALRAELMRAVVQLEVGVVVEGVVVPLLRRVGELWEQGRLRPAQEHVVSAAVRQVLDWLLSRFDAGPDAPVLLATTPSDELHEFGAMLAGLVAADAGWRVVYLGPSLPPAEVALAAEKSRARMVALSVVAGSRGAGSRAEAGGLSPSAVAELEELTERLPDGVLLVAGGSGLADVTLPDGVLREDLEGLRGLLAGAGAGWRRA
jgi:MerR family transcriptional regulator, light-induced transcriptional regulator